MKLIVYPRLYTSRLSEGEGIQVSQGDESVEVLYKAMVDSSTNTRSWPFYRAVLLNTMRLFGDFEEWLREQKLNDNIVGYNRDFLTDTLEFIKTGRRSLPVLTWYDLVAEGGHGHHAAAISQQVLNARTRNKVTDASIQLIQQWVAQPNGLEDLLTTLHLLFGNARNPNP